MRRIELLKCLPFLCQTAIGILLSLNSSLRSDESLSYFRSDHGHAVGSGTLPTVLDPQANLKWRCTLAPGHSTPCPLGDRIFLTTYHEQNSKLSTLAVDTNTGQVIWEHAPSAATIEAVYQTGSPASATVACDGTRVFSFFGSIGLVCYTIDGAPIWAQSLGPFQDEYGAASSPVLADDLVILNEDHDSNNALLAFHRPTGKAAWRTSRDEFTRSYSTPIVAEIDGERQVVVAGALTLTGYSAKSGERRWWIHGLARIVNPMPIIHNHIAYVATWAPGGDAGERIELDDWPKACERFDNDRDQKITRDELIDGEVLTRYFRIDVNQDGSIDRSEWERQAALFRNAKNSLMAIRLGGRGQLANDRVMWSYNRGLPYVASPVLDQGVIFMIKDGGILTSVDAATGQPIKQGRITGRGNYYASPLIADGKLYLASEGGTVTTVTATGAWEILGAHNFEESIYATPIVHNGRLYVRTEKALYCFDNNAQH